MPTIPLAELLASTNAEVRGNLPPDIAFRWVERDSRSVRPGDLFIAVKGERFDGHQFVPDAVEHGAAAALVARAWLERLGDVPIPLIVVEDPVAALQRLAAARRSSMDLIVVGITGSIGKTSTKEVVAAVLSQRFSTYRSPGNMNSEIGLPLSLLEVEPGTEVAVLEMGGAYASGELALLAEIARPKIAVVTNVYPVHLERMGSIAAIAETKAELVEAIPPDGVAVLNGDDERVRAMAPRCRGRVVTYGLDPENVARATDVKTQGLDGSTFWLHLDGERLHVKVPLVGGHAVDLSLAGIAVGHALGMHISEMLLGFSDPAIQVRLLIQPGPNGSQIIDDTYNASTPSVLSALGLLFELRPAGRRIAVLGDMREMGPVSEEEHRIVGRRAADVVDHLVTFGDLARTIAEETALTAEVDGRSLDVTSFGLDQREEMVDFLRVLLQDGDVVLLKGSRGLEMETIVEALRGDIAAGAEADGSA
ncbi:MAG: UDP-N-acetylmuramoyl-tripeptide--D-alanyl-D-alanine ligase [Thermomicrobiales bacterium]